MLDKDTIIGGFFDPNKMFKFKSDELIPNSEELRIKTDKKRAEINQRVYLKDIKRITHAIKEVSEQGRYYCDISRKEILCLDIDLPALLKYFQDKGFMTRIRRTHYNEYIRFDWSEEERVNE